MKINFEIEEFISNYSSEVVSKFFEIREIIFANLPEIQEILDIKAKMIAYCYGKKYAAMICTVIPSKKGLKLGFYKGVDLPDPEKILKGEGKISRYIEFDLKNETNISQVAFMLQNGYKLYENRRQ